VAGFHVEYSGMRFAIFFLAEYANMFTVAAIATTLFLGGWDGWWVRLPGLSPELSHGLFGLAWFQGKCYFLIFIMMWLRWTLARVRVDQLMDFSWKVLLPLSFANLVITGWVVVAGPQGRLVVLGILLVLALTIGLAVRGRGRAATVVARG